MSNLYDTKWIPINWTLLLLDTMRAPVGLTHGLVLRFASFSHRFTISICTNKMDDVDVAIFFHIWLKLQKKRKRKSKKQFGDGEKFFNYFRMLRSSFDDLLEKIDRGIIRKNINTRNVIPPQEMLDVTLG